MEELYGNIDYGKPVHSAPATDNRGSSSSKKRFYVAAILSLGLLSVCLLVGLIVLAIHFRKSEDLSSIKEDVTEQSSYKECHCLTKDKDQLNGNLAETKHASLSEQIWNSAADLSFEHNLTECLQTSNKKISSLNTEINQLNAKVTELTDELNRLKSLSKQENECPDGWSRFSRSCYFLSCKSDSWDNARKNCRDKAADLVVINSAEEQTFLSTFTEKPTWIGLSDKETEGIWKWVDGSAVNLKFWANGQPDNGGERYGEEDCAHFRTVESLSWNDLACAKPLQWICERYSV